MAIVYQLEAMRSPAAQALFEAAGVDFDRPFWEAAFDGRMPSRLFVDDPDQPRSALLTRTYDFFLAGDVSVVLLQLLRDAPPEAQLCEWFYGFVPLTAAWREALPDALPGLVEIERRAFRLPVDGFRQARDWNAHVPDGVRIVPLDAELARRADDEIPEVIGIIWDGCERFAVSGWGYAALDDAGRLLSAAYACGLTGRDVNLGVGTAQPARRRGLGKLVCQACIARAEGDSLTVTWDCDRTNIASGKLAESLGFVEENGFIEFGFPERMVPEGIEGRWSSELVGDGVVRWRSCEL